MRVIASVQSKRGSSRGLVHYIAHSKIDTTREPERGREMFNAFADKLSVRNANNSIKADILLVRPSNDELHHLVLSFRAEDYMALGRDEKRRRAALKETTRAAMKRLETALDADRILWAAAIHCNTENPHVHIAIQKEFMRKDLDTQVMTRVPREALPHFEVRADEKALTPGILIEAATERMEQLIAIEVERARLLEKEETRNRSASISHGDTDSTASKKTSAERGALRRGILAEHEIYRIESRIAILIENRHKMRFRVTDPVSGQKRRLSLYDLEQPGTGSDRVSDTSAERQIKAILLNMLAKEEAAKESLQKVSADTIREANGLKKLYRKNGWKLPIPSLKKNELDRLQDQCLEDSNIRKFSYLESIRTKLERSGEIEPRKRKDLDRIAAEKTISELRSRLLERNHVDLEDRQYYRLVQAGNRRISLARLDREENTPVAAVSVFTQKIKETALRLVGKPVAIPTAESANDRFRNEIVGRINEQLSAVKKNWKTEEKKASILKRMLATDRGDILSRPSYSSEQLGEIEELSVKLKLRPEYESNWNEQRSLIESAAIESPAYKKFLKANPGVDFLEYKNRIVAGRALAREIVAKVQFKKAREDLQTFTESKKLQKFAITDKETGSVSFFSLHDVDLSRRGSLLDRAMEEAFESNEHRALRRTVFSLVKDREQRLKDDVNAAKDIAASAARDAIEFKQYSFFGLRSEPIQTPLFTSSEITQIEIGALNTKDPKEAARLETILESASNEQPRSLKEMLRDFENPQSASMQEKERDPAIPTAPEHAAGIVRDDQIQTRPKAEKTKEPSFHGYSR